MNDIKYWEKYYLDHSKVFSPSPFAKFVVKNYNINDKKMLDICSGDGTDTFFLGDYCNDILGVDNAVLPDSKKHSVSFLKSNIIEALPICKNRRIVYCRFGLHVMEEYVENLILEFATTIFLEFRSDKDKSFVADHYRRLINGNKILTKMIQFNYHIQYFQESTGLSLYKNQDPYLIRIIGTKNAKHSH